MNENKESVKVTVHCVGVLVMPKVGACMMMMQITAPCALYCVALTPESSDLVSPLYEHTLLLHKDAASDTLCPLIEYFTGATVMVIQERIGYHYRLDSQYKKKDLEVRIRQLFANTFFLEMDRSHANAEPADLSLLGRLFASNLAYGYLDCRQEDKKDWECTKQYLEMYTSCAKKKYRGDKKTLYDNYWVAVIGSSVIVKQGMENAVAHFMCYTKADLLYTKTDVIILFRNWKHYKAIASYFCHRLHTIEQTYAIHKSLKDTPKQLLDKLWLLRDNDRLPLYEFCVVLFKRLVDAPSVEQLQLSKEDLSLGLFKYPLNGELYTLVAALIRRQPRLTQEALIEKIKRPLLKYCIMYSLEEKALHNCNTNKASLDAVTLGTLYTVYHQLTSSAPFVELDPTESFCLDASEQDEQDPVAENEGSGEEEATVDIEEWVSNTKDFGHQLAYLYDRVPHWHTKPQPSNYVRASKTVLFFISPTPQLLTLERECSVIYDKYIGSGKADVSVKYHSREPIDEEEWQNDWLAFKEREEEDTEPRQQYQFVLFSPLELMQNEDVECLKKMLFGAKDTTTILREASDVFFLKRLSHYFAENQTQLKMSLFHRDYCIASAHFVGIKELAIRETVLIPQAHTLSLGAIRNILQWCIMHREVVRRVVFLGTPFLLPSLPYGQGFLDLVRQAGSPQELNRALYDRDARNAEFAQIVDKYWRSIKYESPRQLANLLKHTQVADRRVAYLVKNEEMLFSLIESMPKQQQDLLQRQQRRLYCLENRNHAKNPKYPLVDALTEAMSVKQKALFVPECIETDRVCAYNCLANNTSGNVFIITTKTLVTLDKNLLFYLFMLLDKLVVLQSPDQLVKGDLFDAINENVRRRYRPNMRYSHFAAF